MYVMMDEIPGSVENHNIVNLHHGLVDTVCYISWYLVLEIWCDVALSIIEYWVLGQP